MKKPFALFAASLVANVALVAVFVFHPALAPPGLRDFLAHRGPADSSATPTPSATPSPASVPAHLWFSVQTEDLKTLVARLRATGFPDRAIRAVIQALLKDRHESLVDALHRSHPALGFWRASDPLLERKRRSDEQQLSAERTRLEREILGSLKFDDDYYTDRRRQYGELTTEKIDRLDRLNTDYNELDLATRTATNGIILPEDREKLARLEREKRADLAALLSPAELADYDIRNSPLVSRLSSTFGVFRATEEEFRAILQTHQSLEDALYPYSRLPPSSDEDRTARSNAQADAEAELDIRLRTALGDQRYAEFTRAQSREYQNLVGLAARTNLPPQAAIDAYNLRDRLSQESNRIFYDDALDIPQKRAALATLAQTTRAQLAATLGPTTGETYLKTATWLGQVERGGVVTFRANGTSFRGLPANPGGGRTGSSTATSPLTPSR